MWLCDNQIQEQTKTRNQEVRPMQIGLSNKSEGVNQMGHFDVLFFCFWVIPKLCSGFAPREAYRI